MLATIKGPMSSPQHKPTDEQRKTVRAITAYGIDPKMLRLHYSHEIETDRT